MQESLVRIYMLKLVKVKDEECHVKEDTYD